MESKWLEDFLSLAETGSFSKSAQIRHVTQPAFSRRIQALEAWLGADLIDRTAYPTKLTKAGEIFRPQALEILGQLNTSRMLLRGQASKKAVIDFAVPHTLSLTFFPKWLTTTEAGFGEFESRLTASNVHDAAMRLAEGNCDLLMAYHHAAQPLQLDPQRYDMLVLGNEPMAAYCSPKRKAEFNLNSRTTHAPYLAYSSGAYFSRMAALIMAQTKPALKLEKRYETDMAEGLKAMAVQGHGIAFLPESAALQELKNKRLVLAGDHAPLEMQIRLYRLRPEAALNSIERSSKKKPSSKVALLDALWRYIASA